MQRLPLDRGIETVVVGVVSLTVRKLQRLPLDRGIETYPQMNEDTNDTASCRGFPSTEGLKLKFSTKISNGIYTVAEASPRQRD